MVWFFRTFLCTFADRMKQGRIETITTRIISTTFIVVALAVFKPFGLEAWQWQGYMHLIALGVIGFSICMMTDIFFHNDAYLLSMTTNYNSTSLFLLPSFSGAYQGNHHKN